MGKKLRTLLLAICLPALLYGQAESDSGTTPKRKLLHNKNDFTLFLSAGHLGINEPYNSTYAGGMKIRMFLGERFSFDSGFLFGKEHGQFGFGTFGIPIWLWGKQFTSEGTQVFGELMIIIALMILSAEHVAYHIPADNSVDISPYVSVLRIKSFGGQDESVYVDENLNPACFSLGVEINTYFKRFVVAPYVDYNLAYSGDARGFNIGINVGYYFPTKH